MPDLQTKKQKQKRKYKRNDWGKYSVKEIKMEQTRKKKKRNWV